ncbi:MAG: hypothetical protein QM640_14915 [Niabella sp.]
MKILFPPCILFFIYACNTAPSTAPSAPSGYSTQELIPKDTLLACIQEAADIINTRTFKATDLLPVFKRREAAFKIKTVYMPVAANSDTAQDVLHVFINPSTPAEDSNFCVVEITNLPLTVAEKNNFISLQDIENKFGPGKLIPWHSNLGLPPPKEYQPPVRFPISNQSGADRPAYLSVISDRPDDKNYKGLLYLNLCY